MVVAMDLFKCASASALPPFYLFIFFSHQKMILIRDRVSTMSDHYYHDGVWVGIFFFLFINAGDKPTKRALSLYKIRDLYYYIIFVYIDSLNFDGNHLIYMCGDCCCCCCCRMLSQRRRNRPPPVCHALKVLRV